MSIFAFPSEMIGKLHSYFSVEMNSGGSRKIPMKVHFFLGLLVFTIVTCSCSINSSPSQVNNSQQNTNENPSYQGMNTSVPWAKLNLTGKLIYNAGLIRSEGLYSAIQSLDLSTGEVSTVFQDLKGGWINDLAVAPNACFLVMSYTPPPGTGMQDALYSIPLDGSQPPQLLFTPPIDQDQYYQPTWSPDGRYVYFAHFIVQPRTTYEIMRMIYPDGKPEKVVDHAYWPRLSEDGTRLVYVSIDPATGANSLFFANADGTNAQQIPVTKLLTPMIIDAPMFSPDNQTILFSSPPKLQASATTLFDKIMGVSMVAADGTIPSDWWSVPLTGGEPNRLTRVHSLGLYGSFSPDKKHIASYSMYGIFVMKPDGTGVNMLVNDVGGINGTVNWIP